MDKRDESAVGAVDTRTVLRLVLAPNSQEDHEVEDKVRRTLLRSCASPSTWPIPASSPPARRPGQLDDRDNHDDDDNDDQYDDVNDYRVVNRERPNAQFLSSIVIFIKEF